LARLKEALRASTRFIAASELVRDAKDEETASTLLFKALTPLAQAGETLRRMCHLAALTPERAGDAPAVLEYASVVWMLVANELLISRSFLAQPPDVLEAIRAIVIPDARLIPAQRPVNPVRLFLAGDISRAIMRRFLAGTRRRRFVPSRIADAPRRVSRGRAPPALALCPL
jgi:hypothetical protein